jgi:PAS domain S-box-containing protein
MSQFWQKLSITTKFTVSFGVLLLLLMMIAGTGYVALRSVHSAEKSIEISTEVEGIVLEMERAMEKARRLHGDFFLHYPSIGFSKAYDLYARQSAQQIAKVFQYSGQLKEILQNPNICVSLQNNHVDLNLYVSSAKRFSDTSTESIQLIKELSDPMDGLENLFEHTTVALQNETSEYAYPKELLEKMLLFSKDYLITRQRHFMQSSFNILAVLQKDTENKSAMGDKQKVLKLLVQWQETAEKILAVDVSVKSKIHDFSLQTETTDPVSSALIILAKKDVEHSQLQILQVYRFAIIIMAVITFIGLLLAVIIARILNNSITRNIIKLTHSTGEFQKGNLDVTVDGEGPDELGQLAGTFNTMAARIKELVNNLERKVDERTAELRESEKRFRAIVENTTQGILIVDIATMKFLYANPAVAKMLGYSSPEELAGKEVADIHPEKDRKSILVTFTRIAEGEIRFFSDAPCLRKNGTTFYADIVTGEVNYASKPCLVVFFLDTTEKRNLQTQLERARKMEAIGLLAGGVAHDLNNILSGIVSYPELLLLQLPPDSALRRPLNAIHESGKRAAAVVSDLLTVARGVASTRETANLNDLILEYLASPEHCEIHSSHTHIVCRKDLDPNLANISCSAIHVKKCLLNLMMNAMEAITDTGSITISTRNQNIQGTFSKRAGLPPGDYVVLSLSDTGHGIKQEDIDHIFEPFYTKKVMGKSGTGLGLAVVWSSMQDHGGNITVESSENGTAFHLFFPATYQHIMVKDTQTTIEELQGNGESILVVDDEPQQLDISTWILQKLNYTVHCADSGKTAIAYMEHGHADLILLDMIMEPGLNGLQTFERILQLHPGQKALIVSGFAESDNIQLMQGLGARGYIKKPYSIRELGQAVKDEMRRKETRVAFS